MRLHNKIIATTAREHLAGLGCVRIGRSRTWLDDQGWWAGVIEFQPSSYDRGSYLNVGACFLWYERDYLSFDYGHRVREAGYVEYLDEDTFRTDIDKLAALAKQKVVTLRDELKPFQGVTRALEAGPVTGWSNYHCGVASALAGDTESARGYFQSVIDDGDNRDWAEVRRQRAEALLNHLGDRKALLDLIESAVNACRALLKLDGEWSVPVDV